MNREGAGGIDAPSRCISSVRDRRAGGTYHRALRRVVLGRGRTSPRSTPVAELRGMPRAARYVAHPVLLSDMSLEISRTLLLGLGPDLCDATGSVHVCRVPHPTTGSRARGRPHRGDRTGRPRSRVLQLADGLPALSSREDASVHDLGPTRIRRHGAARPWRLGPYSRPCTESFPPRRHADAIR